MQDDDEATAESVKTKLDAQPEVRIACRRYVE